MLDRIDNVYVKPRDYISVNVLKFCGNLNAIKWNTL
jgi:hypothetical protein